MLSLESTLTGAWNEAECPILICLLGRFHLLKAGRPVAVANSGKTSTLLCSLALHPDYSVPRDTLLDILWPNRDAILAVQSLNSLISSLRKAFIDAIGGADLILHTEGAYRLNVEAGVNVDIACFDALANAGNQQAREGNHAQAAACYERAIHLYHGDLFGGTDVHTLTERERLRARHLTLLVHLADYTFAQNDYSAALAYARRLLDYEPCREDAHRMLMRCYVRRGERAQALHQYRVCCDMLRVEFDAPPEPATTALFEQVRHDPSSI